MNVSDWASWEFTVTKPGTFAVEVVQGCGKGSGGAEVEVSVGEGPWQQARLVGSRRPHSWQWWELITQLDEPGSTSVRARATDQSGRTQPERPEWNRNGYGNNSVQQLTVRLVSPTDQRRVATS